MTKKSKNCLVNSYRNTISEWAMVVRYENFLKISSSRGLKKFPYLKTGPFGNPIYSEDFFLFKRSQTKNPRQTAFSAFEYHITVSSNFLPIVTDSHC